MKKKKDPTILEDFFSFLQAPVLLFSLHYNPCFLLAYKREGRASHEVDSNPLNPEPIRTHKHTAEKRPSSRHPFAPLTRDLGHVPLSTVCNPYYELSVLVT